MSHHGYAQVGYRNSFLEDGRGGVYNLTDRVIEGIVLNDLRDKKGINMLPGLAIISQGRREEALHTLVRLHGLAEHARQRETADAKRITTQAHELEKRYFNIFMQELSENEKRYVRHAFPDPNDKSSIETHLGSYPLINGSVTPVTDLMQLDMVFLDREAGDAHFCMLTDILRNGDNDHSDNERTRTKVGYVVGRDYGFAKHAAQVRNGDARDIIGLSDDYLHRLTQMYRSVSSGLKIWLDRLHELNRSIRDEQSNTRSEEALQPVAVPARR